MTPSLHVRARRRLVTVSVAIGAGVALGAGVAASGGARTLRRSWSARVAIAGASMEPTLASGDWILVDPDAYARRSPEVGELVLAPDPREPERLLIKRVQAVDPDGRLRLIGDAPGASTDSRSFGAIQATSVLGRPWLRYWPWRRLGRVA